MIGYSDDAKVMDLLAPLRRLEPVPFAVPEGPRRRTLRRPVLMAAIVVVALALAGVAIANGVGAFNGISAAQHKPTGARVLPPKLLAEIKKLNAQAAKFRKEHGFSWPAYFLPDTARVLGKAPDGTKVYGLTNTYGDLCLFGEVGGSCSPPLDKKHPITFATFNASPTTGGTFIASGVAIDGVASVSFKVWSKRVTVPVRNNVWVYKQLNTTAHGARCVVVHFADGSSVHYPPTQCF
jgi:hypothetical protein